MAVAETNPGLIDIEARQLNTEQLLRLGEATLWVADNREAGETRWDDFLHLYVGSPEGDGSPPEVVRSTEEHGLLNYDRVLHEFWTDSGKLIQIRASSELDTRGMDGEPVAEKWFAAVTDLAARTTNEWVGLNIKRGFIGGRTEPVIELPLKVETLPTALTTGNLIRDAITLKRLEAPSVDGMQIVMSAQEGVYVQHGLSKEKLHNGLATLTRQVKKSEKYRKMFGHPPDTIGE
jgi:hypothetical protein